MSWLISIKVRWVGSTFLQCDYYTKLVVSQPATHKKTRSYSKHTIEIFIANVFQESKIFHQTMFFYSKLYITPRRHICFVWHVVFCFHLQAISLLPLPWFALKCDLKSKLQLTFTFFASVTQSNGPLKKHGLPSAGTKGHVCRFWLVDFDPYCLFRFVVVLWLITSFLGMYCYFPVIRLVNFV